MFKKNVSYYPGCSCSKSGLARYYGSSSLAVLKKIGVNVSEIEDWNCCGSNLYRTIDENKAYLLGARNLAKALEMGLPEILILCPACFLSLKRTLTEVFTNSTLLIEVKKKYSVFGNRTSSIPNVRHIIDFLVNDIGEDVFKKNVEKKLDGLKVAPYYGCQITRPYGLFDDPEFPTSMERIFSWIGANPIDSPLKTKCCGGMLTITNEGEVLPMIKKILESYIRLGAECIVTACPLCHLNLEIAKMKIKRTVKEISNIPIMYFTQLIGLSFNLPFNELGITKEIVEHLNKKIIVTASLRGGKNE
ncbi:MAG: CoB--CoM heterodisulfide reductase iron-sulfur subunit B family protein [Aigarchaeota archaeon]|nr:CoB--CoM heterodisulfide reductase iron-sulfur subunit B family protein [Aigarchaeota archaeon]MDW7985657.1 CoB--CoM heterodisulfide reductase iron-sulfur subunit B family protein [Nitrososphaerota archaeon]